VDGLYQNLAKVVECHRYNSVCVCVRARVCVRACVQNVCLAAMAFTSVCAEHTLPPLRLPASVKNIIVAAISVPSSLPKMSVCHLPLWLSVCVGKLSCNIALYLFLDKASPLCFSKYKSSLYMTLFVINHQRHVTAIKAIFRLNTKLYRKYMLQCHERDFVLHQVEVL